jgi:UDP-N-acetyl-D-mannosaminuronic acid dehydrogenase
MELKKIDVGIIGLGYVGLTLATVLAECGYKVLGIEKREEVVELTNSGTPHFSEKGLDKSLANVVKQGKFIARQDFDKETYCGIYIITVGTPLSSDGIARLDFIENATNQVAANMRDGALVILRSTVKIGVSRNVVSPILEKSGKKFDIAMCPERTLEGNALRELKELPQIIGADKNDALDRAAKFFSNMTKSVVKVSSLESAEIVKLIDNTYRDVQFAFANEVARLCQPFGVNAFEVISSGKLGYPRTNVPLPGLVGGPCLEKDPHILIQSLKGYGLNLEITAASRLVNERQPLETVSFISKQITNRKFNPKFKIAILGMAFKGIPPTDDLRGSMSVKVFEILKEKYSEAQIFLFDPVISYNDLIKKFPNTHICKDIDECMKHADLVVITNNHNSFKEINLEEIRKSMSESAFIYDYWNLFSNLDKSIIENFYYSVGNTQETK